MFQFIFGVTVGLILETYTGWGVKLLQAIKNIKF